MYRCTSEACHFCLDIHKSEAGLFWMISQSVSFDGINTIKGVGLVVGNYRRLDSVVSGVVGDVPKRVEVILDRPRSLSFFSSAVTT